VNEPEKVEPAVVRVEDKEGEIKVSALSQASIRKKRELEQAQKVNVKQVDELPREPFTETDMLLN